MYRCSAQSDQPSQDERFHFLGSVLTSYTSMICRITSFFRCFNSLLLIPNIRLWEVSHKWPHLGFFFFLFFFFSPYWNIFVPKLKWKPWKWPKLELRVSSTWRTCVLIMSHLIFLSAPVGLNSRVKMIHIKETVKEMLTPDSSPLMAHIRICLCLRF